MLVGLPANADGAVSARRSDKVTELTAQRSSREWRNWQTRWLQVPVPARAWGFKSPLAHENGRTRMVRPFFVC